MNRPRHSSSIEALEARIAPAFGAVFELSNLTGANGFKLSGGASNDIAGAAVSDAGDVNGDGFGDVIIGAPFAAPNGIFSGASYVVFGKASGFAANLNLTTLDGGSNGFKISGVAVNDTAGRAVSGAGDVNGDGFDDVIIGAPDADPNGSKSGASYVIFGKGTGFAANLELSALDGSNGFKLSGAAADDNAGGSVSAAGDVNGDGFDDVIIGAYLADPNGIDSGASYVVFGKATGFAANFELSTLDGSNGFKLSGVAADDTSARSVSEAGDVNGDGFGDLLIGSPFADPNGSKSGATYVVFGKASGFAANLDLTTIDGSNGFRLSGVSADDTAGLPVSAAGDVNGDGFDDVIVGAYGADLNGSNSGANYVVFGKAIGFAANLNLSTLDGGNGFKISGVAANDFAATVSGAGDLNGDGFDDVIIGAGRADPNGDESGASYVVFGKASGFAANLNLATLDGRTGFRLDGVAAGDVAGASVSAAGDVNGDGLGDLIVGASRVDLNGSSSGAAYVVFGEKRLPVEISASGKTAKFTDVDGDLVKVKSDRGEFTQDDFVVIAGGQGGRFEMLDLAGDTAFARAKIKVVATTPIGGTGDGFVDLGYFNATGLDVGKVKIDGDLGQIDAGDGEGSGRALKGLKADSIGTRGLATQGGTGNLGSDLNGDVGNLAVLSDVNGATLIVLGRLGDVTIGGDIGNATFAVRGELTPVSADSAQAIASLTVLGDVFRSRILAGYGSAASAVNPDAGIGVVFVKGGWNSSDLVAGVVDATQNGFGRNDTLIAGGVAEIIARIASVTIKGAAIGSAAAGDHFGITAEQIGKLKIGLEKKPLTDGSDNLLLDATHNDFRAVDFL